VKKNNKVNNTMKNWTITVEEADDGSGDLVLPLPQELLDLQGWKEGDTLEWTDLGDGSWTMKKAING
jgi:hypothetical protein